MPHLFVFGLLAVYVGESAGCGVTAPLPKQDALIDMGKFEGTWYESLTTFDAISLDHACKVNEDFRDKLDTAGPGFEVKITVHYDNAATISFHAHSVNTESGRFKQIMVERNDTIGHEVDENGKIDPRAVDEETEILKKSFSIVGDPNYYYAVVKCSREGWAVWVFTKGKTITPEQFVHIHNDLLKNGISVPWRLARCGYVYEK